MPPKRKLLFLTNSEQGAANIHLAVSYEILVTHQDVEVHFASFPKMKTQVQQISDLARKSLSDARTQSIIFHPLSGPSITETVSQRMNMPFCDAIAHAPGVAGAIKSYNSLSAFAAAWTGEEHLRLYAEIASYIQNIDPTLVILDPVMIPGVEACRDLKTKHVILSPNGMQSLLAAVQPRGAVLWKYPVVSSGFPYPLPLYLVPLNIYLLLRLVVSLVFSPDLRAKNAFLKRHNHNPAAPFSTPADDPEIQWLFPSRSEIDFPISVIPDKVTPCGPIILHFAPVAESDAELAKWLALRPTVVINLGSLYQYDKEGAENMLGAVRLLLKQVNNVQVLWKLPSVPGGDNWVKALREEVGKDSQRLRILHWIPADMAAVLSCEAVIATVHHGGAGSYHEAICAGIPQVVLPMWNDL